MFQLQLAASEEERDAANDVLQSSGSGGAADELARYISALGYKLGLTEDEQRVGHKTHEVKHLFLNCRLSPPFRFF